MESRLRVVQLTTDNRDPFREYHKTEPWFGTAPEALFQGFAELPHIEVHVVACTQQPMRSPEKLAPNIFFHSLHVPKLGWMRTAYQGCIRATRAKIRELRPDVVHGQGTERDCALSAVYSGFPNVLTIHGNMRLIAQVNRVRPGSFQWLAARLERWTIPRSDGVVCITNYTRAAVADLASRTWVVPNAVDPTFFSVEPQSAEPPLVLCVGNIGQRKNQNALLEALDPLAARRPLRVVFLGGAPPDDGYTATFFRLLSERPWAAYGGFAGRAALREQLRQTRVLALPSLEDNCPMAVLEAMAAGVPVVAARVGGLPDLIQQDETGLFCDPFQPESISDAIGRLLDDPLLGTAVAARARQEALSRFHPAVVANRHLEIYRELSLSAPSAG
jgi:glycosyltransferase involved in cell wall biosynthesis